MEIKICGLTVAEEAGYLNEAGADYAGFVVFFEKSKRCVTVGQAQSIFPVLSPAIRKVAVTVAPTVSQVKKIQKAGFDILQVHKELAAEVLEAAKIPVWYAFNIKSEAQLDEDIRFLSALPRELSDKITALVVDGAEYGSGKTFEWNKEMLLNPKLKQALSNRKFVLAGGLSRENVAKGIRLFHPDIVDVSSGVEGSGGKDRQLVRDFVQAARSAY